MASSLDDRPEYETLQDELDRAAKLWANGNHFPTPVLQLLEHYIEYICEDLLLNRMDMINEKVADEYFQSHDLSVWEFKGGIKAKDHVAAFTLAIKRKNM